MKNYQCKKCEVTIQGAQTPLTANCPKGSNHQWTDLGEVGSNNYQCKRCSLLLKSKNTPNTANCPKASSHYWTKL